MGRNLMSDERHPEYDQPAPIPADDNTRPVHDEVIDSLTSMENFHVYGPVALIAGSIIAERHILGKRKYGTVLHRSNGRDHRRDLLEELADACAYARCTDDPMLQHLTETVFLDVLEQVYGTGRAAGLDNHTDGY